MRPKTETTLASDRNDLLAKVRKGAGMSLDSDQIDHPGAEHPVDVTISFSASTGPVSGTVSLRDGEPASFHGWLELMDALERMRAPLELRKPA